MRSVLECVSVDIALGGLILYFSIYFLLRCIKKFTFYLHIFQAIKDLQISVRDAILLLKVLLEEIEHNADKEKTAVTELYDLLLEKITEMKTSLIEKVDRYE